MTEPKHAVEILVEEFTRIDEIYAKQRIKAERFERIMLWSIWILGAIILFTPFIQIWLADNFCN